ncbi:serine/threonine-protein kinase [Streptomyces sp. NPDC005805]|uniref:serine/threonine-protein kinase n=1 Tax=Streptomyces sp. NPDC005805 TaxID=3157068 RepID=UPI0033CADF53
MNTPGDLIDERFELTGKLGSGGMGTVWRARDTVLHRDVALKAVRSDASTSGAVRERVLREARALARLSHPHVVTVHHIVDSGPHPWIVMELVEGVSLQERLEQGPLSPAEAARTGRQILSALRAAHAAGIQHRDVKPANVLLRQDGTAVLTDFGIAALHDSTALTATGELVGSPEYMAPERVRGTGDDPAADLWSLGLVLYVCVEGVSPMRRATTLATLAAVLDEPVPPPVRSGPLTPVLQALLVRDPAARPDAAALDALLARVEEDDRAPVWAQPTTGVPVPPRAPTAVDSPRPTIPRQPPHPPAAPPERRGGRTPLVVAAVAVAVAVTAVAGLVFALRERDTPSDAKALAPPSTSASVTSSSSGPASGTPSPSASPSPSPSPSVTPSGPAFPSPTASAVPPPPSEPPGGRWIAQLFSEPVASGTAARDMRLARVRESVPEAEVVRSDDYASLRPGFWVIYAPGPFEDGRAALRFCADRGRTTPNTCMGRYLSESQDDYALQCRPPASDPSGYCTRRD